MYLGLSFADRSLLQRLAITFLLVFSFINSGLAQPCTCPITSAYIYSASVTNGCPPYTSVLSITGPVTLSGLTFQWQVSPDNITWTDIPGATNTTYTATVTAPIFYRGWAGCSLGTGSGCARTVPVALTTLLGPISGPSAICTGTTVSMSDPVSGGVWSSGTPAVATIGSTSALVTGLTTGTTVITHSLMACSVTKTVTVYSSVGAITGPATVCTGLTASLSDPTPGGTWTSSNPAIAIITSTGIVTGIAAGTVTITYSLGGLCTATFPMTVITPGSISGPASVCVGSAITLSNATPGGTWTSSNPAIAAINPTSGIVSGLVAGAVSITYSLGAGCTAVTPFTVNPLPPAITGASAICIGTSATLSDAVTGGTWTSGSPAIALIGSASGIVTAMTAGTATITYTLPTGCFTTRTITINPAPAPITGIFITCIGTTTTLFSSGTGTWTSGSPGIATVGAGTGIVTGLSAGSAVITYTLPTGCFTTVVITVHPTPPAITGSNGVCIGATITLSNATAGGTWSSSTPAIATAGSATGIITGILVGPSVISYTSSVGCVVTKTITVHPFPAPIVGLAAVCAGTTITLSDAGSGTWTSGAPAIATVGASSGIVSGIAIGSATITYTLPTGCIATKTITVTPPPTAISGATSVCSGTNTLLSDGISGGTWSSSNPAVGSIDIASGLFSGTTAGTTTVTYSLGVGCTATRSMSVLAGPGPITGASAICTGLTSLLSDAVSGGTWSSSTPSVATISSGGLVSGISPGTSVIGYILSSGCAVSKTITVNSVPPPVTGTLSVCLGLTTTLSDAATGGVWTSSTPAIATIGSSSGIVTGVSVATVRITYSLGTGCSVTASVTILPLPATISGPSGVCSGNNITLSDASPGGTWSTTDVNITVGAGTGIITGITAGPAMVTYTLPTGCITTKTITVNPSPGPITGIIGICAGHFTTLTNVLTGGSWTSSNPAVATAGISSGIVTGISPGITLITYSPGFGCIATTTVTVFAAPPPIVGVPNVCVGSSVSLSNAMAGGTWSTASSTISVGGTGIVSGVSPGTGIVTYTSSVGCTVTRSVTVSPLPPPVIGVSALCTGSTTILSDAVTPGTWSSGAPGIASVTLITGIVTGSSAGTANITYTLATGCNTVFPFTVAPSPSSIGGSLHVCEGATTTLTNTLSGGTWSSGAPSVATINPATGVVTGIASGTAPVTYSVAGCIAITTVTVDPVPGAITGSTVVCAGLMVTLSNPVPGGSWRSSNMSVAIVGVSSGNVLGILPGTVTISYTLPTGCSVAQPMTVNPVPPAITGPAFVCEGSTVTLSDPMPGGTWSSGTPAVASVSGGMVTGISPGLTAISYTISGCPALHALTVRPLPAPITGAGTICGFGSTITLSDASPMGIWTSAYVTISPLGVVTGYTGGIATVTYTLPTGCLRTASLVVHPYPGLITGSTQLCIGHTTTLSDTTLGGTWLSGSPAIATIGAVTGIVTGITAGTADITYTAPTGCPVIRTMTVTPLPTPFTGITTMCAGETASLSDPVPGGTWTTTGSVVSVHPATGLVTAISAGTAQITYTLSAGCMAVTTLTILPLPAVFVVSGGGNICAGGTGTHIGLTGSSSGIYYQLFHGSTPGTILSGTGSPLDFGLLTAAGTYTVVATNTVSGCTNSMFGHAAITVTPSVLPAVSITPGSADTSCTGTLTTFTAAVSNEGTLPAYQWQVNGMNVGFGTLAYSYVPANGDIIKFILTSNAVCALPAVVSNTVIANVLAPAYPVVTITADPGFNIYSGKTVTLTAVASGSGLSYQWLRNSSTIAGANSASYTTTAFYNDTFTCVVTTSGLCPVTSSGSGIITIGNVGITPATAPTALRVLPNPGKGVFTIDGSIGIADGQADIQVFNTLGQVVYSHPATVTHGILHHPIHLAGTLPNGMYLLRVQAANAGHVFHLVLER